MNAASRILLATLLAGTVGFTLAGCDNAGPAEKAGEKIDETLGTSQGPLENTGETLDNAYESTVDAVQDGWEKTKDATEDALESAGDALGVDGN